MWKQRLPKKPQYMQKEDFEMEERSLLLTKEKLSSIYILIQYIWYQNILLKLWNALRRRQQYKVEYFSLLYIAIFV